MKNRIKILVLIIIALLLISLPSFFLKQKEEVKNVENKIIESNLSTTEIPNLTEVDEQTVEVQETEKEGFQEQGEIAYNGSDKAPNIQTGNYQGLTYYSQVDNRWKDMSYTSVGDYSQTIGSSGCGPTSAAMVVSSTKGTITPPEMAQLYVQNGYRSANNGTYWSAYRWTADVFGIEYQEASKLDTAVNLVRNNNFVIASVGSGLFTYGGHFIVIVGVEGDTLKIYDPYLYNGKFDTGSRKGKVSVSGNTVYCSIDNFRKYANYKGFFAYKNDRTDNKENNNDIIYTDTDKSYTSCNYTAKVTARSGLNIRSGASTSYKKVGGYAYGSKVTITAEANGFGKTSRGWICLAYTSKTTTSAKGYRTGTYTVNCSELNVRTGPGTNYRVKNLKELTASARKQGGYKRGVRFTVSQVKGNWGKTPSGWVCLNYAK